MCDLVLEPEFAEEMLDHILDYKLAEGQMYIDLRVDAVRLGDDWGLQKNLKMPPHLWMKFIKPRHAKLYKFYKDAGLPVFQHSCGDISIFRLIQESYELFVPLVSPFLGSIWAKPPAYQYHPKKPAAAHTCQPVLECPLPEVVLDAVRQGLFQSDQE